MCPRFTRTVALAVFVLATALAPTTGYSQVSGDGPSGTRSDSTPTRGAGPSATIDMGGHHSETTTSTPTDKPVTPAPPRPPVIPGPPPTAQGPSLPVRPNLFMDMGRCGHDAWPAEATAGLTDHGFSCAAAPGQPPPSGGRSNYTSTRVDTRWVADRLARYAHDTQPMPEFGIRVNPNPGVVAVPSWFWIDRATYANAPIVSTVHQDIPWDESWDSYSTHAEPAPCPDDPTQNCPHEVTETINEHHHHVDTVDVVVTFTPAVYRWSFGDLPNSVRRYPAETGLGHPYTTPTAPSPVSWSYQFDSRDHSNGFTIGLTATWSVSFHSQGISDVPDGTFDAAGSLDDRSEQYATGHVVRQVQAPRIAAPLSMGAVP